METPTTLIYAISNKQNGRKYIGSTTRTLASRKKAHLFTLRKGHHHNLELQADFKEFGEDAFEFEVLQDVGGCKTSYLLALEELHIALQGWQIDCYNAANPVGGTRLRPRGEHRQAKRNRVPVIEQDSNGNEIARWDSLGACCRDTGLGPMMVSRVARGLRNHTHGRFFAYVSA